jgi:hypothetical protein
MARKNTPIVYKRVENEELRIRMIARRLLKDADIPFPEDWEIFVVDQKRGTCNYVRQYITIPLWVIRKARTFKKYHGRDIWYLSHELAHIATRGDHHGMKFMEEMKKICPEEYQNYEYRYKPRRAKAAGVSQKGMRGVLRK